MSDQVVIGIMSVDKQMSNLTVCVGGELVGQVVPSCLEVLFFLCVAWLFDDR